MVGWVVAVALTGCNAFKEVGTLEDEGGASPTGGESTEDGPSDPTSQDTSSAEGMDGGSTTTGSTSPDSSSTEGLEGGSSTTDGPADLITCPAGPLEDLDCPAVGDVCEAPGDFACDCVCNCDDPNPQGPGWWECDYTRYDELLEVVEATLTIDCDAATVESAFEVILQNDDGSSDIAVTPHDFYTYRLVSADGTQEYQCGAYDAPDQFEPIEVAYGEQASFSRSYPPVACNEAQTTEALCAVCGGTASIRPSWIVAGPEELASFDTTPIDNVAIECP